MTRRQGSARRLLALAVALFATLVASALSAAGGDYRQAYLDGLRALRRDDFRAAADLLSAAVAARGDEQAKARLVGAIPEPYLPQLYLGLAFYGLQDCERASAAWSESARQGVASAVPPATAAASGPRRDCAALAAATTKIGDVRRRLRELAARADAGSTVLGATAAVSSALDRAAAELEQGRERWDFAVVGQAAARATEASATLGRLTEQAAARRRAHALGALTNARDDAAALVEQVGDAPPPRMAAHLRTVESLIDQAGGAANPEVSEDTATALAARLRAASAELRLALAEGRTPTVTAEAEVPAPPSAPPAVSPAQPSGELVAGLEAFLDRDYPAAIALLGRVTAGASPRSGAFALVLRAAAEHALYLLGSGDDASLLAAAVADIRAARRLDPGLEPDPDTFSPRFVALFRDPR